ncbi:unnamed protein product [Calypogeia fissa]
MAAAVSEEVKPAFEWRLWPPSEDTRAVVADKMVQHLMTCTPPIEKQEAVDRAKRIEQEAYTAASQKQNGDSSADTSMAQVRTYARHASGLLLDFLKAHRVKDTFFDISGQKRDFLTKEGAENLFKPLGKPGNKIRRICLSNWSFGKDAAEHAGEVLASVKGRLDDVNLADIVAGRPEAEALEVMTILSVALAGSKLESLNLSDNALGEKGVRAFSELLKSQTSLQRLYFMNNGISVEAAQAICELLTSPQNLRTLHFHNNMSGDGGAQAVSALIEKSPLLRDFQFSSTRVASDGGLALAKALKAGTSLKRIDLRDNMFGPEVGVALSSTFRLHPELSEAYLSDIGLQDKGTIAIVKALEDAAPNLKVLELGGNEITAKAAPSIASCIKSKPFLNRLSLAENVLTDTGAVMICEALQGHTGITYLDLSSNRIQDEGGVAAVKALFGVGTREAPLEIHLEGNFLSEDGVEAVAKAGGKNHSLNLSEQEDADDYDEDEEEAEDDHENGGEEDGEDGDNDVDDTLEAISSLKVYCVDHLNLFRIHCVESCVHLILCHLDMDIGRC